MKLKCKADEAGELLAAIELLIIIELSILSMFFLLFRYVNRVVTFQKTACETCDDYSFIIQIVRIYLYSFFT